MYVSITGLQLISPLYAPKFLWYAIPATRQAHAAPGNLYAGTTYLRGTHHTMTVWEDRSSMLRYMRTGDHAQAMKIFDEIATGKTYGYETDDPVVPTWDEMRHLYDTKARVVGKAGREAKRVERGQKAVEAMPEKG